MSAVPELDSVPVGERTCLDFVYFRQMLLRSRTLHDDNIAHRLNDTPGVLDARQCQRFYTALCRVHRGRQEKLDYCIGVLGSRLAKAAGADGDADAGGHDFSLLRKQLGLLESERVVEEIVTERSRQILFSRCRSLQN